MHTLTNLIVSDAQFVDMPDMLDGPVIALVLYIACSSP